MFKFRDAGFYGMKENLSDKKNNKFANCPLGKKDCRYQQREVRQG